jgi:hypothetical protein
VLQDGRVIIAQPDGGVALVGDVPPFRPAGIAWIGHDLEIVPGNSGDNGIHVLSNGTWTRAPAPRLSGPPNLQSALVMVERSPRGNQLFTHVRAEDLWQDHQVDVVSVDGDGQQRVESVRVVGIGFVAADHAAGGGMMAREPAPRTIERIGGVWQRFDAPVTVDMEEADPVNAAEIQSDYVIEAGRLTWIPRVAGMTRIAGNWTAFPPADDHVHVLPASGGDLWILTDEHEYVRTKGGVVPERVPPTSPVVWLGLSTFPAMAILVGCLWLAARRGQARRVDEEPAAVAMPAAPGAPSGPATSAAGDHALKNRAVDDEANEPGADASP